MRFVYLIVILGFAFFLVTFGVQNNDQRVTLTYFNYAQKDVDLYLIVFIFFAIGFALAAFLGAIDKLRMTLRMNKLYRKIDDLEQKNLSLLRSSQQPLPPTSHPSSMM